jgi:hypothetical protein
VVNAAVPRVIRGFRARPLAEVPGDLPDWCGAEELRQPLETILAGVPGFPHASVMPRIVSATVQIRAQFIYR